MGEWDMNEQKWLSADTLMPLLKIIRRRMSPRKRILLATAICRSIARLLDPRCLQALEMAEECVDGRLNQMNEARELANAARRDYVVLNPQVAEAYQAVEDALHPDTFLLACQEAKEAAGDFDEHCWLDSIAIARCIAGNPFRPFRLDSAFRTSTVLAIARAAYDQRAMPSGELDNARLAILADALEEAGVSDQNVLRHLRGPGPHVRGCFAVDAILRH
jgi:hypothetical protein